MDLPTLPFDRANVLEIAPRMRELQAEAPITRVRTATGDEAWLVTRYDEVKALFADPRLGRSHPKPAEAARISQSVILGGASGDFDTEDVDHARLRSRLVPRFSARRMRLLKPRVEELVDGLLTKLEARTPPVDLHEALSFPLPVLVICELLGVPFADREHFRALSTGMADLNDNSLSAGSYEKLIDYVRDLVRHKRTEPGNDMLSELITIEDGTLTDDEIAGLGAIVLFAGHETTVVRIDVGTLLLLQTPGQYQALADDPTAAPAAVEEILRLSVGGSNGGILRYAKADVAIGVANQDEQAFTEPDRMDIGREPANPHLSFGHGARYCIGAALARAELTAVFERLPARFPSLRLATELTDLRWRSNLLTGGLAELPVTW
jgi:pentalenolactone synthase